MDFYSRSKKPPVEASPSGEDIVPVYSLVIDKETGKKEVKQTGKRNIYKEIQAHKEECLVYNILERHVNGDTLALNQSQGFFADISNMPKSLNDAQEIILNAETLFKEMPVAVRSEFNHSMSEFVASISNGTFEEKINKHLQPQINKVEPIVQPQVQNVEPINVSMESQSTPVQSQGVNLGGNI
ncbi:MAG: hypothetical protein IJF22_00555 [Clostridia bacterium]|nr:hypothetical protein [Clostridia bacterium]